MLGSAWPNPILRMLIAVVGAAVAHPGDRVVGAVARAVSVGSVRSVGAVWLERLKAVEPAVPFRPLIGGPALARRRLLAGFPRRRRAGARRRGSAGGTVGSLASPGGAGPTRTLGHRLDDLGFRWAGVPRPRRLCTLDRPPVAGSGCGGLGGRGARSIECCLLRRGGGTSSTASSSSLSRARSAEILAVTADSRPLDSAGSAGAARRRDMPHVPAD